MISLNVERFHIQNWLICLSLIGSAFVPRAVAAEESSCKTDKVASMVKLVNETRRARGLEPVECSDSLADVAADHSRDMCKNDYVSHVNSSDRDLNERLDRAGIKYRTAGENIAKGSAKATAIHRGWMDNPAHRKNVLKSNFERIGIGFAACENEAYWTQVFAGSVIRIAKKTKDTGSKGVSISTMPNPPRSVPEKPSFLKRLYGESFGGLIGGVSGLVVGSSAAWIYSEQNQDAASDGWIAFSASAGMVAGIPTGVYLGGNSVGASGRFWPALAGTAVGSAGGLVFVAESDGELTAKEYLGIPAIAVATSVAGYELGRVFEPGRSRRYTFNVLPSVSYSRRIDAPVFGISGQF